MCYRTRKYTFCRCVRASFSPEIVHAGAVTELSPENCWQRGPRFYKGGTGRGGGGARGEVEGYYLTLFYQHQNDFCA